MIHYSRQPRDICKKLNFCLLLKMWAKKVKTQAVNKTRNFLIMLNNLKQVKT